MKLFYSPFSIFKEKAEVCLCLLVNLFVLRETRIRKSKKVGISPLLLKKPLMDNLIFSEAVARRSSLK